MNLQEFQTIVQNKLPIIIFILKLDWALSQEKPVVCELMLSKEYCVEPKAASKMLENGKMVSASLDDMAPFLPEKEVKKNRLNS